MMLKFLGFSLIPSQKVFFPFSYRFCLQTFEALPDLKHILKQTPSTCSFIHSGLVLLSLQQEKRTQIAKSCKGNKYKYDQEGKPYLNMISRLQRCNSIQREARLMNVFEHCQVHFKTILHISSSNVCSHNVSINLSNQCNWNTQTAKQPFFPICQE